MKPKYYVIVSDNIYWQQARGPYTFKKAMQVKNDDTLNTVIAKLVIDEEGKEVK